MSPTLSADTMILGAGIAGLRAAQQLQAAGESVLLLDKARHPGGRCATRRLTADPDSPSFDIGAQYLTARAPAFARAVRGWVAQGVLQGWSPRLARQSGPESWEPSSDATPRWLAPGGFNQWPRAWAAQLQREGLRLHCSHRVQALEGLARGWRVHGSGAAYSARRVLLAMPPAQAAALLLPVAPQLCPSRRLAPCLTAVYAAPAGAADFDALFGDGAPLAWAARSGARPGARNGGATDYWTLHAGVAESQRLAERDPQEVAAVLGDAFAALIGLAPAALECVHARHWRYARLPEGLGQEPQAVFDADAGLGLCGDWLGRGRIEDAWLSGDAAAQAVLTA